jgi:Sporulation and spore germination
MTRTGCRRAAIAALSLVASVLFGVGCAIQPDSAPRDIPDDMQEPETPSESAGGGAARGSDRIYLLAPDDAEQPLRTVRRSTNNDPTALLTALISGPNTGESEAGLRSAIPSTLELNSVRVNAGVVEVDLSDALLDLSGGDLTDAIAQIVFTASEIPRGESVLIRVDGATQEWPDGSGTQHRGPLTTFDFIGWAESAQPAFPVTPAPTTAVPPSTTTTLAPTTTAAPTTAATTTTTTTIVVPTTVTAATTAAPPAPTTTTPA